MPGVMTDERGEAMKLSDEDVGLWHGMLWLALWISWRNHSMKFSVWVNKSEAGCLLGFASWKALRRWAGDANQGMVCGDRQTGKHLPWLRPLMEPFGGKYLTKNTNLGFWEIRNFFELRTTDLEHGIEGTILVTVVNCLALSFSAKRT